jgi:hypothetical protein
MTVTRQQTGAAGGYNGVASVDKIPSCTIEDVDTAVHRAFTSDFGLVVTDTTGTANVRVIFAAGERWNQVKKGVGLRDANGSLILPLIAIARTGVSQDMSEDVCGRGINQHTGKLIIKRSLSKDRDPSYQRLINRTVRNSNLWHSPRSSTQLTRAHTGDLVSSDRNVAAGGLLRTDVTRSVFEITTIPSPQFVSIKYDVKIWTAYMMHMNQLVERLISNYLPNDRAYKLTTTKGYWFVAYVEGDGVTNESNADNVGAEERLIKCSMQIKVPAYIVAPSTPGAPASVRTTLSSPDVSFEVPEVNEKSLRQTPAPFLGSDDPTLPLRVGQTTRADKRETFEGSTGKTWQQDPALQQYKRGAKLPLYNRDRKISIVKIDDRYVRSRSINHAVGETAYDGLSISDFELAVS